MAYTPLFGTGFELGTLGIGTGIISSKYGTASISGTGHTGNYAVKMGTWGGESYFQFNVASGHDTIDFGVWLKGCYGRTGFRIEIGLDSGYLRLHFNSTYYRLYHSDNGYIASGSVQLNSGWYNLQARIVIGAAGSVDVKIDGILDIAFSGDVQPGTATEVTYIRYYVVTYDSLYVDDFTYGTGGWPGDLRFDIMVPNGDTATEEFALSEGADSYALLDTVPANDAKYLSSAVNGQQTIVDVTDWDSANKIPQFAVAWARAKKDTATAQQIKLINSDGVDERIGSAEDLLTTWTFVYKLMLTAPDGGAWEDADADALQLGAESVIV